jgi:DNA-binding IclR family transcriptional regulator
MSTEDYAKLERLFRKRKGHSESIRTALTQALKVAGLLRGNPMSFSDLQREIGLPVRTLRRSISRLRSAGYDIRYDRLHNHYLCGGFVSERLQ